MEDNIHSMKKHYGKIMLKKFICCLVFTLGFAGIVQSQADIQPLLIDVRTPDEFSREHVKGALNIEYQHIVEELNRSDVDKNRPIELYCRSGNRSGVATRALRQAGYENVTNLGGLEALKKIGYPVE